MARRDGVGKHGIGARHLSGVEVRRIPEHAVVPPPEEAGPDDRVEGHAIGRRVGGILLRVPESERHAAKAITLRRIGRERLIGSGRINDITDEVEPPVVAPQVNSTV